MALAALVLSLSRALHVSTVASSLISLGVGVRGKCYRVGDGHARCVRSRQGGK